MSMERLIDDLRFVINKINDVDVRNASDCEIVQMFLQMSNHPILIEVQQHKQLTTTSTTTNGAEQKSAFLMFKRNKLKENEATKCDVEDDDDDDDVESQECLAPEIDIQQITLQKTQAENFGVTLCCNAETDAADEINAGEQCCSEVFINYIEMGGIAANDNRLRYGDQILQINGQDIKSKQHAERFLDAENFVTLLVSRYITTADEINGCEEVEEEEEDDDDDYDVDDCENEQVLNYENYLHEQAYINLVNSLDKALLLTTPQTPQKQQHLNEKKPKLLAKNCNKNQRKQQLVCAGESDESEHIYETIPEDSETEPLYCSPYESGGAATTTKAAAAASSHFVTNVTTTTTTTSTTTTTLQQLQHLQKKKQQRVAQWLGIAKQQPAARHAAGDKDLSRAQIEEHDNSSSAYNTGGSNASIPLQTTNKICSPKNSVWKKNYIRSEEEINVAVNGEHDDTKKLFNPLMYAKTCGNFLDKPKEIMMRQLQQQQQPQQQHPICPQFTAPNLSQYHFVSSQEGYPATRSMKKPQTFHQKQQNPQQVNLQQQQQHHMVWKVKRRSDGTRYIVRRPVPSIMRHRLLEGMSSLTPTAAPTTEDDTISEVKLGRYWTKEERKRHVEKARERRVNDKLALRLKLQQKQQQQEQLATIISDKATIPLNGGV